MAAETSDGEDDGTSWSLCVPFFLTTTPHCVGVGYIDPSRDKKKTESGGVQLVGVA